MGRKRKANGQLQYERQKKQFYDWMEKNCPSGSPYFVRISELHATKQAKLEGEKLIQYYLDAMPYLKKTNASESDLHSYTAKFFPSLLTKHAIWLDQVKDPHACEHCGGGLLMGVDMAAMICMDCAVVSCKTVMEGVGCASVWDSTHEQQTMTIESVHLYKRLGHMKTFVLNFQGKSKSKIPQSLIDGLLREALVDRHAEIDPKWISQQLKKKKMGKYHTQRYRLAERVSNTYKCERLPPHYLKQLFHRFSEVSNAYDEFNKQCKEIRKNFLSYPFLFMQLNKLLGFEHFNTHVAQLKSKVLLKEQERIWTEIKTLLKW